MSRSRDLDNEVKVLTREFEKQKPFDTLQFCANFFQRRLEAQRAEFLLGASKHSADTTGAMASTFPGTNPFASDKGIHRLAEEEDHFGAPGASPTTRAQANAMEANSRAPVSFNPAFGTTSFDPGSSLPPMAGSSLPTDYNFNRRTSVSAESMNPIDAASDNWTPPFHSKTPDQEGRLRQAVSPNFLFSHLDETQTKQVLGALQEKPIPAKGIKVICQGDAGDYFYVVEKGNFDIYVSPTGRLEAGPDGMGKKVTSIGAGGSFGELALMYNAPRAATVVSTESSTLWALDRVTFRRILMDSAFQRRQMYESFLSEVPLLQSLTPYERSKIADALHTQIFPAGHTIIREGDPGESFFILEYGHAEVYKRGKEQPVHRYGKGDYFGELALLDDKPRAASVVSQTDVKLATLGKEGFQRLLGPVEELMRRNDPSRKPDADSLDPLTKPS